MSFYENLKKIENANDETLIQDMNKIFDDLNKQEEEESKGPKKETIPYGEFIKNLHARKDQK